MRLTLDDALDEPTITALYELHVAAFAPMAMQAAARHLLSAEEFAAEMRDKRIDKYVAWDGEVPVALVTLTSDLSAVPWISPGYFTSRYPEAAARGALYYGGHVLARPDRAHHGAFALLMNRVAQRLGEERAVVAYDMCAHNVDRGLSDRFVELSRSGNGVHRTWDTQTYSALDYTGTCP